MNAQDHLFAVKVAAISLALILGMSLSCSSVATHSNTAIVPVPQTGSNHEPLALQRAKDHPGNYDIEFIGDSITEGWEGAGENVWQEFYGRRRVINMGVGGERTQNVLWRFEQGQLSDIKARVAVVLIGTNNSNGDDNSAPEILEGVTAIVNQIRQRQPTTKIILLGIFPRSAFRAQRDKILLVNQGLARLDDGGNIYYIDIRSQLMERDGSLSMETMPDLLHLSEQGYRIWAQAIEPKIKELLAQ
jgi:lysophospholipase L1-like esterase